MGDPLTAALVNGILGGVGTGVFLAVASHIYSDRKSSNIYTRRMVVHTRFLYTDPTLSKALYDLQICVDDAQTNETLKIILIRCDELLGICHSYSSGSPSPDQRDIVYTNQIYRVIVDSVDELMRSTATAGSTKAYAYIHEELKTRLLLHMAFVHKSVRAN